MTYLIGALVAVIGFLFFNKSKPLDTSKITSRLTELDQLTKANQASVDAFNKRQDGLKQEIKDAEKNTTTDPNTLTDFFDKR